MSAGSTERRVGVKLSGSSRAFSALKKETLQFQGNSVINLGSSHTESLAPSHDDNLADCAVYHFHDTANLKRLQAINDNVKLRHDAGNLAAFLYKLKRIFPKHYELILKTIRQVAPFFGDFHLRPYPENPQKIQLEWTEKGSDYPFIANELSDGTLRFMCLATLLLQPEMPPTILIDEPELGLHPQMGILLGKSGVVRGPMPTGIKPPNQTCWETHTQQVVVSAVPPTLGGALRRDL
jgi:predicted ATPase